MKSLLVIIAMIILCVCSLKVTYAQTINIPTLLQTPSIIDTSSAAFSGNIINVADGGDLQSALDIAKPGDQILLQAGATFTGNFTLPAKDSLSSDYIYIRTSEDAKIPASGNRIFPAFSEAMPKINSPNAAPAIKTSEGAHHYYFIGIEFGISEGVALNFGIVVLGDGSSTQNTLEQVPHNLVIDRCYIHGNNTGNVSRGIALNSASSIVIDCYISNCHAVGFDSQAICGWNGPGPFKIVNNYLEGAGENILFGGADPAIQELVPSDIEFRRNHCFKPLSWKVNDPNYGGIHWSVKNLFELKNAQRILIDGNVFENNWADGQTGFAILFTPRNQDGKAPWSVVQDIKFTNNIVRHAGAGINILGRDDIYTSQVLERIEIFNNLFDEIGGLQWGGSGRFLQMLNGAVAVTVNHNTIFHSGDIIMADSKPTIKFIYTNNISRHNEYGIIGSGTGIGSKAIKVYFPDSIFTKNVFVGGHAANFSNEPNNFFPSTLIDVNFTDLAGGNHLLAYNSPYKNAGTTGTDLGADINEIEKAISGSDSFIPSSTTSYSVIIKFHVPAKPNMQIEYGTTTLYDKTVKLLPKSNNMLLENLSTSTVYYYRIKTITSSKEIVFLNGFSFVTLTKKPPVISKIHTQIKAKQTIISWNTDEPTETQIEYGTTTSYGESVSLSSSKTTTHRVILDKLLPKTIYHYRIKALNSNGNLSVTSDQSFKTPRQN